MVFEILWKLCSAPQVKADSPDDDELVDPFVTLKEKCSEQEHMKALYEKYQECNDRVNSRTKTTETCMEELVDYVNEVSHCATHHLFDKLK